VRRTFLGVVAACGVALVMAPLAHAGFGDTHVNGTGVDETIDCNGSTLYVLGTNNTVTALGSCYAVTVQGSGNTVVADNVVNDITVYGNDETVLYKGGDPLVSDVGRQLDMTNRIDRIPA
jgi:hypothetical protein